MPIPSSWLVHRIRTAGGYVYAMIEKTNVQSNSMFFVDLTDNNQLFGLPQYEAKGVKSVVFDPRLFVTTYSWDFAVAPSGRSNLRFYIFRRAILDDPVSLWMYDLLIPNSESERDFACTNIVMHFRCNNNPFLDRNICALQKVRDSSAGHQCLQQGKRAKERELFHGL